MNIFCPWNSLEDPLRSPGVCRTPPIIFAYLIRQIAGSLCKWGCGVIFNLEVQVGLCFPPRVSRMFPGSSLIFLSVLVVCWGLSAQQLLTWRSLWLAICRQAAHISTYTTSPMIPRGCRWGRGSISAGRTGWLLVYRDRQNNRNRRWFIVEVVVCVVVNQHQETLCAADWLIELRADQLITLDSFINFPNYYLHCYSHYYCCRTVTWHCCTYRDISVINTSAFCEFFCWWKTHYFLASSF